MNNSNSSLDDSLSSSLKHSMKQPISMKPSSINKEEEEEVPEEEELILSSSLSSSLSKPMDIPIYRPSNQNKKRHSQYSMKSLPALISEDDEENSFTETLLTNGYYFYSSTSLPDDFQVGSLPKKLPSAWPIELVNELTTPSINLDDDDENDKRFSFPDVSSTSSSSPSSADHQNEPILFDMDD